MNGEMKILSCEFPNLDNILDISESYEIYYHSDIYNRTVKLWKKEVTDIFSFSEKKEIKWYRRYRRKSKNDKDGYSEMKDEEYNMLENEFMSLKRKDIIQKVYDRIGRND